MEKTTKTKEKKTFWQNLKEYLYLYWTMFHIGASTFGGGYAMVSIIEKELVEKRKWMTSEELMDYVAISQITPGIIAVNVSTFVGNKRKGIPGGIVGTLGTISPAVIIVLLIAIVLNQYMDNVYVLHAFAGIRIAVCVLIAHATIGFIRKSVVDVLTLITFLAVLLVTLFTSWSVVYTVIAIMLISVAVTECRSIRDRYRNGAKPGRDNSRDGGAKK